MDYRDLWRAGILSDATRDVRAVTARHGVVLAGGDQLYMLRGGEKELVSREAPGDMGAVHAVAVEPRLGPRLAACSPQALAILDGGRKIMRRPKRRAPTPVDLAWGRVRDGSFALYVLDSAGRVSRIVPGVDDHCELELEGVQALSSDDDGNVALAVGGPQPGVYVTQDGGTWHLRPMEDLADSLSPTHLAVAGEAAAVSLYRRGTWISRRWDDTLSRCDALGDGGALAFEGMASDAAILCAVQHGPTLAIMRVDAVGSATRLAEISGDVEPELSELSWDATRRVLWGAMPGIGLLKLQSLI